MNNFTDKTVLITGATGDFGRAFARRFHGAGARLILHGRSAEKLAALKNEFPGALTLCFDVTDRQAIANAMADLESVDVLINNAGAFGGRSGVVLCVL